MHPEPDRTATPRECQWDLDGLRLAGLAWGPEGGTPVLALHGWMDHADSFQELAPRLAGCHVIAPDLSGQGKSGHRAAHATYNIWDDLPQIAGLLDRLGWQQCVLLGHSRGAIIATLFAAAQPERVRALVALDGLLPPPAAPDSFVTTLRAFMDQTHRQNACPARVFPTRSGYVDRRCAQGNTRATAEALADRALERGPQGFRLRGDPRLFASSAVRLTQAHLECVVQSIRCPVLNLWAQDSADGALARAGDLVGLCRSQIPAYEMVTLPGDHHFHLDAKIAPDMARIVLDFLRRHPAPR